jgi:hypothetical protein
MINISTKMIVLWMLLASEYGHAATAFINGHWYQGSEFVAQTRFVEQGIFVAQPEEQISNIIDLQSGYVVPPLAEAHNHNLQNPWLAKQFGQQYIDAGIFYSLMMCGNAKAAATSRQILAQTPLQVAFASACISSSDGHPLRMALTPEEGQPRPQLTDIYDKSYIVVDTVDDIATKWPLIAASQADIVKLILVNSEDESRRGNEQFFGINGLKPEVVAPLTRFLQSKGLRVAAHVDSAADFSAAVNAGVDIIAHLPGYNWQGDYDEQVYTLRPADIALAAEQNIAVITTAGVSQLFKQSPATLAQVKAVQKTNLLNLKHAGVSLLIGSDRFDSNVLSELDYLEDLGVFSREELLSMLLTKTVQTIWPDRKLGQLTPGYQADFLVLAHNPLLDLSALRQIRLRVSAGQLVTEQQ